jgi:hypothetical protein
LLFHTAERVLSNRHLSKVSLVSALLSDEPV